jgi:hypothetical protein
MKISTLSFAHLSEQNGVILNEYLMEVSYTQFGVNINASK